MESYIGLSKENDKYVVSCLDVYYDAGKEAEAVFNKAKADAIKHLSKCNVNYEVLAEKINVETCEDIYHPYGMFDFKDIEDYYTRWNNMLVVTTGCLSRSGGINPTASMLHVIDEFIEKKFNFKM